MRRTSKLLLATAVLAGAGYGYWRLAVPEHRVAVRSELVMLGDLDGDGRWSESDLAALEDFRRAPFGGSAELPWRLDLNQSGALEEEDVAILEALVAAKGDPYAAEAARPQGSAFPRPRELYRYLAVSEYRARPLWALPYPPARDSVLTWLPGFKLDAAEGPYARALDAAIFSEAVRLDFAYRRREPGLSQLERDYAGRKLARVESLSHDAERYELLLALIELVEDAETLTAPSEPTVALKLLALRDHLRQVLGSQASRELSAGRGDAWAVLKEVSAHLKGDLDLDYAFETLGPARDFSRLENYLERAEWQYYKSSAREDDFLALVGYAQHDPRYLRAVARTSRRLTDPLVENHNLPMVLLFREALRLTGGDKKKAVGLLDEAIRIPYAWIKSIPREALPGSLALDNFLLPGNKEDGADKSRHWNVFGGLCLYKSPEQALDLALRREMQDLRDAQLSAEGMREFLRDLIADLNGMYHVMSVRPAPLTR